MTSVAPEPARPVDHYENFPAASWLCPRPLRPPIAAIYWFARTADDLADEGDAPAEKRFETLGSYGSDLAACYTGRPDSGLWPQVFGPLRREILAFELPRELLERLLDAFRQDVAKTQAGQGYADRAELLAYCSRSADPVGRLLLHLYGVREASALAQSDAICSALQLINFWQDLGVDVTRGRYYLPDADCRRLGLDPGAPSTWSSHPQAPALVAELCGWARELMLSGAALVHRVPGRAGWELRLVVQGGLRILDKIRAQGHDTLHRRPKLGPFDVAVMLWRSVWM